jgi:hypothetical protein
LLIEELHNLYFLIDIIRMIKSRRKRKSGGVKVTKKKSTQGFGEKT